MKPLPKHLRTRWRYFAIAIETWPSTTIDRHSFREALEEAAASLLGDIGVASADLSVLAFSYADGYGEAVIKTPRDAVEEARAVMACLSKVDENPVRVHVIGVSGTIRACEEKYLGHEPEETPESSVVFEGAERTAVCRRDMVDIRVNDAFVGATAFDIK